MAGPAEPWPPATPASIQALVQELLGGFRPLDAAERVIGDAFANALLHHGLLHRGLELLLELKLGSAAQNDPALVLGCRAPTAHAAQGTRHGAEDPGKTEAKRPFMRRAARSKNGTGRPGLHAGSDFR